MPTKKQILAALRLIDEAVRDHQESPCAKALREDLIQSPEVAQMGAITDMIEQAILVEQISKWPKFGER